MFLLVVAETPGVPAPGVLVVMVSCLVHHADVVRSPRLVISTAACLPGGTWRLSINRHLPGPAMSDPATAQAAEQEPA